MSILDEIVEHKKKQVQKTLELYPVKLLEQSEHFEVGCVSLSKYLTRKDKVGVIAEIKRQSPSKGVFQENISVEDLSIGYMQSGASALSVLTDKKYFGGTEEDLRTARRFNFCPILRKDFIVDEYQIFEARSIGADAILLIASILSREQMVKFASRAHDLGMEVLLEVHDSSELDDAPLEDVDIVGVNNRNLKTFDVSIDTSLSLVQKLPSNLVKVAESGISTPEAIVKLAAAGFDGFLIGEAFMSTPDPVAACSKLIKSVKSMQMVGRGES